MHVKFRGKMKIYIWLLLLLISCKSDYQEEVLFNASFDSTRELLGSLNNAFEKFYQQKFKKSIKVNQSNASSSKQRNSILFGLKANIASLALYRDINILADNSFLNKNWQSFYPNNSSPYGSLIVMLVRKNNPYNIHDWHDLLTQNVAIITPNPKTSGAAVYNYMALLKYAEDHYKTEIEIENFMTKIFKKVPMLDSSSRNATLSFTSRNLGDVLISWENEALYITKHLFPNEYEIIYPSITIKIDFPVAEVTKVTQKNNNHILAKTYIDYLFSDEAQDIISSNYFRPYNKLYETKYNFKNIDDIKSFSIWEIANWDKTIANHLDSGGLFDKIYS